MVLARKNIRNSVGFRYLDAIFDREVFPVGEETRLDSEIGNVGLVLVHGGYIDLTESGLVLTEKGRRAVKTGYIEIEVPQSQPEPAGATS